MFDDRPAGQPYGVLEAAMTTGTVLAFIFTGITVPVAIVGGIWLEARMTAPRRQRGGPPRHVRRPGTVSLLAGGYRADLGEPARDRLIPRGRHHR
jgi:hypothetical protein